MSLVSPVIPGSVFRSSSNMRLRSEGLLKIVPKEYRMLRFALLSGSFRMVPPYRQYPLKAVPLSRSSVDSLFP